ncbi:MAG: hypothetical protein M1813_003707 [Trichoglossum hirsutum]|nr:MAG: hypothetical protein M1813_003707 [Trichoglossum hirsutum]
MRPHSGLENTTDSPIKGLDEFRHLFKSVCADLGLSGSQEAVEQIVLSTSGEGGTSFLSVKFLLTGIGANLLPRLLSHLQTDPAAWSILSERKSTLFIEISSFITRILERKFSVPHAITLCERVISDAPSREIWDAVQDLIAEPGPVTPTTIPGGGTFDTPLKSTANSQQDDEQTHRDLDNRILQEVAGCVYNDTGGFYKKYFEGKPWEPDAERTIRDINPRKANGRWAGYPHPPSQDAFFRWFWRLESTYFSRERGAYYSSPNLPLGGSTCSRKPDLFLALSGTTECGGRYNWRDVRVIGELKQSVIKNAYLDEFKKFCGHAREVFASQPTRLFLHGFIIRGSTVELWVYDRSGPYSCERFDLHASPDRFIKVIVGYTMMSDEELGLNTYIEDNKYGKYIMIKLDGKIKKQRLYLEEVPIASQRAIVCRGTTCYRAKRPNVKDWGFVVKFSWRSDKRRAEGELLQLAKDRGVWGVAELCGHEVRTSIAELRQGLQFGKPRIFPSSSMSPSQNQTTMNSSHPKSRRSGSARLGIGRFSLGSAPPSAPSSRQKRKRTGETAGSQPKRSKSGTSLRQLEITNQIVGGQDDDTECANKCSVKEAEPNSLVHPVSLNDEPFDNRIFCCLVVSPPGRAIKEFRSILELLEAFRDIIKGHRSLYQVGKILHRDVSINNVIITDAKKEEDPRGMLIDLDLAKEMGSGPSGARHRTGTMEFMAIEVLECKPHTYRHDLESLFYVFLWVIIQYGQQDKMLPEESCLREWHVGSYFGIASNKTGVMVAPRFEFILDEFPPEFESLKDLARELRQALFSTRDGSIFLGTFTDSDNLYDPMIKAFDRAVANHKEKESHHDSQIWDDDHLHILQ